MSEGTIEQSGEWKGEFFATEEEALDALKIELDFRDLEDDNDDNDDNQASKLLDEVEKNVFSNDLHDYLLGLLIKDEDDEELWGKKKHDFIELVDRKRKL